MQEKKNINDTDNTREKLDKVALGQVAGGKPGRDDKSELPVVYSSGPRWRCIDCFGIFYSTSQTVSGPCPYCGCQSGERFT